MKDQNIAILLNFVMRVDTERREVTKVYQDLNVSKARKDIGDELDQLEKAVSGLHSALNDFRREFGEGETR